MINEEKLLTDAQRITEEKAQREADKKEKVAKLLARKRDFEQAMDLKQLIGDTI